MDSLQTKIKECLPEKKELRKTGNLITEDEQNWLRKDGYNECLLDVHSSIPKIIEIVREEYIKHLYKEIENDYMDCPIDYFLKDQASIIKVDLTN